MRADDGREVLVTLALPMPLNIVSDLLRAIGDVAENAGYTDVSLTTDGTSRIVATPPGAFRCPRCSRVSHNPNDRRAGYCGACHDWTGDIHDERP